jgi:hypothetical protein
MHDFLKMLIIAENEDVAIPISSEKRKYYQNNHRFFTKSGTKNFS